MIYIGCQENVSVLCDFSSTKLVGVITTQTRPQRSANWMTWLKSTLQSQANETTSPCKCIFWMSWDYHPLIKVFAQNIKTLSSPHPQTTKTAAGRRYQQTLRSPVLLSICFTEPKVRLFNVKELQWPFEKLKLKSKAGVTSMSLLKHRCTNSNTAPVCWLF